MGIIVKKFNKERQTLLIFNLNIVKLKETKEEFWYLWFEEVNKYVDKKHCRKK